MRLLSIIFLLLWFSCLADESRIINAFYRYTIPDDCSQTEAKASAMERAIAEALAQEFGTVINTETWTDIRNSNNQSTADVWRMGSSIVKGEWLETIGEPEFKFISDGNSIVVEVRIKGRAAPLSERTINLEISPLRITKEGMFDSQRFNSGDRLELRFMSPVDGSLIVFLADEEGTAYQLLPFANQKAGFIPISGGEKYLYFHDIKEGWAEQYTLSTDKEIERNTLYILFTPNHIVKPITTESDGIRFISLKAFREWVSRQRVTDKDLQIRAIPLTILN